jgi:hypothetical protein
MLLTRRTRQRAPVCFIALARKTVRATMSADCAEIGMFRKIGRFIHFGETGESPDTFIFYCQHNKRLPMRFLQAPST